MIDEPKWVSKLKQKSDGALQKEVKELRSEIALLKDAVGVGPETPTPWKTA